MVLQPFLGAVHENVICVDEPVPVTVPVTVVFPRSLLLMMTSVVDRPLTSDAPSIVHVTVVPTSSL